MLQTLLQPEHVLVVKPAARVQVQVQVQVQKEPAAVDRHRTHGECVNISTYLFEAVYHVARWLQP